MTLGWGAQNAPRDDVGAAIAMVMDKTGLTEFNFSIVDLMNMQGTLEMDYDIGTMTYMVRRDKDAK
jgi:hypothetical protein